MPEQIAPGREHPLLIDLGGTMMNPVEHIQFVFVRVGSPGSPRQWLARPRNSSVYGAWTIEVCGLNKGELPELRSDYVDNFVRPHVKSINDAINAVDTNRIDREFDRALGMLAPRNPNVAVSYDAFMHCLPNAVMNTWGKVWPLPANVGRP